jgi:replicative DNA helicase
MKMGTLGSYDSTTDYSEFKRRKPNKKYRSHLVSERFLLMIIKVLASDITVNRRSLANIKRFLTIIDRDYYCRSENIEAMLLVCDLLVSIRTKNPHGVSLESLTYKVENLLVEPYDKVRDQLIIPQINVAKDELPEDDLEYITNSLDQNLKFSYILDVKDNLIELTNDIETSSYTDFPSLLHQYRDLVTGIMNFFRSTDSNSMTNEIVHTGDPTFLDILYDTYEAIRNPASALQTGWQALNSALGPRGGFQNKNLYCLHANTNSFKSAMLLHISRMIKEYNASRVIEEFKRTGKIPTVLHISMENDNDEDNERLYKTVVKKDLGKCTSREELNQSWEHNFGNSNSEEENPIDISFLHVDARSLSVDEIDVIIENLEEEGYRVIACVVDYLGLIKPRMEDMGKDNRLQLKNIADDLLSLAKNRDIPVITAHQINRSGGAVLTNLKNQGGVNAISQMTNEFIGESYGIEQAVSWSAFIDIEIHGEDRWLMFKRNKSRYKNKFGTETFVMKIRDGIIIDDDIYLSTPLSLPKIPDGIGTDEAVNQNQGSRGIIDIRDNKHKTPPKDHLIKVKSSTEEREDFLNSKEKVPIEYIDWNNWIHYLDTGDYETEDFYIWSNSEMSYYDRSFVIGETEYVSCDFNEEVAYA